MGCQIYQCFTNFHEKTTTNIVVNDNFSNITYVYKS